MEKIENKYLKILNPRDEYCFLNGVLWIQPSACCYGDYGGSGSVGKANIEWLKNEFKYETINETDLTKWFEYESLWVSGFMSDEEHEKKQKELMEDRDQVLIDHDVIIASGSYGFESAWIKCPDEDPERYDLMEGLYNYPCFEDELVSEVESQWEIDAWGNYIRSELLDFLPEYIQDRLDVSIYADGLTDDPLDQAMFEAYRDAMEYCNEYPIAEYNGVYVNIDRIKDEFIRIFSEKNKIENT